MRVPSIDFDPQLQALERERRQLTDERRAFERFSSRVAEIAVTPPQRLAPSARYVGRSESTGLQEVQKAYTETVIDVSHYADVYGEPWHENMAAEFSTELATAVQRADYLDPQLRRSLVDAAHRAAQHRTQLLEPIETEIDALEEFSREITAICEELHSLLTQPVDRMEFNALRLTRERLLTLRERCDELATNRQAHIQRRQQLTIAGISTFERYAYGEFDETHPVLAAIADLGTALETAQKTVDRSLTVTA